MSLLILYSEESHENRRTVHTERINNSRNHILLQPGDIVIVRITIQSDLLKNKVAKLSPVIHGPYQIIRSTSHGNYYVSKLNKPDSPEITLMAYDL